MSDFTYELDTDVGKVRLLLNDIDEATLVFRDDELQAFLDLEGGSVKRATAQAIDSQATNEALAGKVLRDEVGKSTDAAKLADALRKHAANLRSQADSEDADSDDGFFFDVVETGPTYGAPERTAWPLL